MAKYASAKIESSMWRNLDRNVDSVFALVKFCECALFVTSMRKSPDANFENVLGVPAMP